ncbi:hypothetical protein [Streptomyces sp. WAC01280]|uniref:hypothetical protein n=1 Tax=Streptomyces sp. WAC01280 TaxID=2487424 RepID=UPI000F76AC75|nr:hypothetical protein [Streptomyces sp. WAC01280]RSS50300.1 hypothetical protein EF909_38750 [Streptomyces sp. WAC01280]
MRFRHSVAAACGALALTATLATPAHAATGEFHYRYVGLSGEVQTATLHDPATDECITIPEAGDPGASAPAFAPHNDTDEYAVVFTEPDCTGDTWLLRPHGRPATDRLTLRSVLFFPK